MSCLLKPRQRATLTIVANAQRYLRRRIFIGRIKLLRPLPSESLTARAAASVPTPNAPFSVDAVHIKQVTGIAVAIR